MEENKNVYIVTETISDDEVTRDTSTETAKSGTTNITIIASWIVEIALYVIGAVLLSYAFEWYNNDLEADFLHKNDPFMFAERRYVGGDAYNYIISASRSAAIVTKSLFWAILGCTSIIAGRLTAIRRKKCK